MKNLIEKYKARVEEIIIILEEKAKNYDFGATVIEVEKETLYYVIRDLEKQLEFDNLDYNSFIDWLEEREERFKLDKMGAIGVVVIPLNKEIENRFFSND